jgi:tetratricopeptide (TPR) repeat protein
MAKKVEPRTEILESPEALASRLQETETWMERHPKTVIGGALVIALIVGGYFGYRYYTDNLNLEAQQQMFQAVYYFEADSLELALNGDGNNLGFRDIVKEYKMTDAANLANYYAGAAYLKTGKWELARLYLEDFTSRDLLVQARAYSMIGDTYMEQEKYEDAATYYTKAAEYKPNKYFTPTYLMKAALAYEKLNRNDKAIEAYNRIITDYWDSADYQNARKYKARLEGA